MSPTIDTQKFGCDNEYSILNKVILCPPEFMKIREVINETQIHFIEENIDTEIAIKQHQELVKRLKQEQVQVYLLPAKEEFPEQVFTRDLAFTLGKQIIVGKLEERIRRGEEEVLKKWFREEKIPFLSIDAGSMEGGDVLFDGNAVWIGDSFRTSKEAVEQLRQFLPHMEITMLPFDGDYLHLDCVFNIIAPNQALIYPPAFGAEQVAYLKQRFEMIEVSHKEQFTLGTNVFSIGNKKILSLPMNREVNSRLREWGYDVIEVDISEIIKSGGSFRCVTMPIMRR